MSSLVYRGMKLMSVLFLGFLLPPLVIFAFTWFLFYFFLFLPILCMFNVAVLEYKILVRRPLRYIAMSLVNFYLWVLDDWSKTHEMFVEGLKDEQVSMEVDPFEFPYPDESEEEEEEDGGMLTKHDDSQSLQALKPANRELNPFHDVLSFWKTKEAEEGGKSLKLEK